MRALAHDLFALATGYAGGFHLSIWLAVTATFMLATVVAVGVGRRVVDPVVLVIAASPLRVAKWMILSLVIYPVAFVFLVYTWVGIPLAVVVACTTPFLAALGYVALAFVVGDRLARGAGRRLPPVAAALLGVLLLRCVRLVPFHLGAMANSLIMLFAFAAVTALGWDLSRSWYRRRLPDEVQFEGEDLIEWHPPEETGNHS